MANSLLTSLSSSAPTAPNFWVNPQNSVNYTVAVQTPILHMTGIDDLLETPVTPAGGTSTENTIGNVQTLTPGPLAAGASTLGQSTGAAP